MARPPALARRLGRRRDPHRRRLGRPQGRRRGSVAADQHRLDAGRSPRRRGRQPARTAPAGARRCPPALGRPGPARRPAVERDRGRSPRQRVREHDRLRPDDGRAGRAGVDRRRRRRRWLGWWPATWSSRTACSSRPTARRSSSPSPTATASPRSTSRPTARSPVGGCGPTSATAFPTAWPSTPPAPSGTPTCRTSGASGWPRAARCCRSSSSTGAASPARSAARPGRRCSSRRPPGVDPPTSVRASGPAWCTRPAAPVPRAGRP